MATADTDKTKRWVGAPSCLHRPSFIVVIFALTLSIPAIGCRRGLRFANHPPHFVGPEALTVPAGESIDLAALFEDADGDALTVTVSGWINVQHYRTDFFDVGIHTVTVRASDGWGSAAAKIAVTVEAGSSADPFDSPGTPFFFVAEGAPPAVMPENLNRMWDVFGAVRYGTVNRFGNAPAWFPWMTRKKLWAAELKEDRRTELDFLRTHPMDEEGYVWCWPTQEAWPSAYARFFDTNGRYIQAIGHAVWWEAPDFLDRVDEEGRPVRERLVLATRYLLNTLDAAAGLMTYDDPRLGSLKLVYDLTNDPSGHREAVVWRDLDPALKMINEFRMAVWNPNREAQDALRLRVRMRRPTGTWHRLSLKTLPWSGSDGEGAGWIVYRTTLPFGSGQVDRIEIRLGLSELSTLSLGPDDPSENWILIDNLSSGYPGPMIDLMEDATPWQIEAGALQVEIDHDLYEDVPDGTPRGKPNNYWDSVRYGHRDAMGNAVLGEALSTAAILLADSHPGLAAQARQAAARWHDLYDETFWNEEKGRYIGWVDKNGVRYDYGFATVNLEALTLGAGDLEKAERVLSWLDREGYAPDAVWAPRTNTEPLPDEVWWNVDGLLPHAFGEQQADGGAVLWASYFDLLVRARVRGPDDALERLGAILAEFAKDDLIRDPYNALGRPEKYGIIGEFPESGLVPVAPMYTFLGIDAGPEGLEIEPHLPSSFSSFGVRGLNYRGDTYDLVATADRFLALRLVSDRPAIPMLTGVFATPGNQIAHHHLDGTVSVIKASGSPLTPALQPGEVLTVGIRSTDLLPAQRRTSFSGLILLLIMAVIIMLRLYFALERQVVRSNRQSG